MIDKALSVLTQPRSSALLSLVDSHDCVNIAVLLTVFSIYKVFHVSLNLSVLLLWCWVDLSPLRHLTDSPSSSNSVDTLT